MERIRVRLFGQIQLENSLGSIDEKRVRSGRLLALLAYLILHRKERVQNKVLCEEFIGDSCKNPEGTLKNLMCRLRSLLKELGPEEYICTLVGEYRWNPEIPVEVDCERFGELYREICGEQDAGRKKELCEEAVECYRGNFSPQIAEEMWIVAQFAQNQTQYVEIVELLGSIYEEGKEWNRLEVLCKKALESESFEENIHSSLIRSLRYQGKYGQALEYYEKAKKIFFENFGIWNPSKLQEAFTSGTPEKSARARPIGILMDEICEQGERMGAFFCDYQTFQQIYQLESRRISRMGFSEHLLLLTVWRHGSSEKDRMVDSGMLHAMDILERIIRKTLRSGDVITRSSHTQFIAILSGCSYETGNMVAERIRRTFRRRIKSQKLDLRYELGEIISGRSGTEIIEK